MAKLTQRKFPTSQLPSGCLLRGSKTCDRHWCDKPVTIGKSKLCDWHSSHKNYDHLCECGEEITRYAKYCGRCAPKHWSK